MLFGFLTVRCQIRVMSCLLRMQREGDRDDARCVSPQVRWPLQPLPMISAFLSTALVTRGVIHSRPGDEDTMALCVGVSPRATWPGAVGAAWLCDTWPPSLAELT